MDPFWIVLLQRIQLFIIWQLRSCARWFDVCFLCSRVPETTLPWHNFSERLYVKTVFLQASKSESAFSKVFRLDRADPFSLPKFPEILVERIAHFDSRSTYRETAFTYKGSLKLSRSLGCPRQKKYTTRALSHIPRVSFGSRTNLSLTQSAPSQWRGLYTEDLCGFWKSTLFMDSYIRYKGSPF